MISLDRIIFDPFTLVHIIWYFQIIQITWLDIDFLYVSVHKL